jgi:hypothetical protein
MLELIMIEERAREKAEDNSERYERPNRTPVGFAHTGASRSVGRVDISICFPRNKFTSVNRPTFDGVHVGRTRQVDPQPLWDIAKTNRPLAIGHTSA